MKILFISRYFYPHIGGVEKHTYFVAKNLIKMGHKVSIITEQYQRDLKLHENYEGIEIVRIKYPPVKYLGLLTIWFRLFSLRHLIKKADIIHVHDVFIWYLPLRFIFGKKKVYTTFHGWEGIYPVPFKNIVYKKLASFLSHGTIAVGTYIEKYYGLKADFITYGAVEVKGGRIKKTKLAIFVGRLEADTGLPKVLKQMATLKGYKFAFVGDGPLAARCRKIGVLYGFSDPSKLYSRASIVYPSGYLSALEAMANKCEVRVFWENPLKKDAWRETPFYEFISSRDRKGAYNWVRGQTWEKVTDLYIRLWKEH